MAIALTPACRARLGSYSSSPRPVATRNRRCAVPVRCMKLTEEKRADGRTVTLRSRDENGGGDSLEICRVVNGMWQTSGGWGRIDADAAVDAMLRYADAGLSTFDLADICMHLRLLLISLCARNGYLDRLLLIYLCASDRGLVSRRG
ncbi:Flagellar radial spoke protein 5 [Canna indica]|uniref:Flagellar radial spoke protein 5 n=1 Tax=Canna indica TaxID=4628 RepID=A0AAQ3KZ64_9LILI|nr:Flagellar radial spoke protein 5 [Canna indica]